MFILAVHLGVMRRKPTRSVNQEIKPEAIPVARVSYPDPVFLSGSGFQISLDPVSVSKSRSEFLIGS